MSSRKAKLVRAAILIVLFSGMAAILYLFFREFMPDLLPLLRRGDEQDIENYIRSFGSFQGMLVAALLQSLQVLTIVFPALAVQVAAGILFGWWKGTLVCLLSFSLTNFGVFYAARRLNSRFGAFFQESEKSGKAKLRFIAESDCPEYMILLAYMMPFLPNGFIPYVAARTQVSTKRFLIAMTVGSAPSILFFCAIGNRLLQQDFWFVGILSGLMIAAIICLFCLREKVVEAMRKLVRKFRDKISK